MLQSVQAVGFCALKFVAFSNVPFILHAWGRECPSLCQVMGDGVRRITINHAAYAFVSSSVIEGIAGASPEGWEIYSYTSDPESSLKV